MARIGILTCSNCTQETNCASVVCLADMRKRRGFFEQYSQDEPLDLIGIINCAGCPTLAAPEKILKKVRALTEFRLDALHLSFWLQKKPSSQMFELSGVFSQNPELQTSSVHGLRSLQSASVTHSQALRSEEQ